MTRRLVQPDADALAQLHADPPDDMATTGLLVDGHDPFAARRQMMRERISGPDPRAEAPREKQQRQEERPRMSEIREQPTPTPAATPRGPYQRTGKYAAGAGKTSPKPSEVLREIVYCPECKRQLKEGEYTTKTEEVIMTSYGGLVRTECHCVAHQALVKLTTEFVVLARSKEEAQTINVNGAHAEQGGSAV